MCVFLCSTLLESYSTYNPRQNIYQAKYIYTQSYFTANIVTKKYKKNKKGRKKTQTITTMSVRPATHAGSWFEDDKTLLSRQIQTLVAESKKQNPEFPVPGARVLVGP